ncbi:uncharacterized protein LOC108735056 [Agrilus planipennis]|uniref:Uncharacterized protein LOC108735056 n=1 Tax=Agrilus planipennis TaxID=224129 RepID=A0A1W4WQP1_AGRPL|nr:uncharacterized protein LOC108735056 [Agrilus planipennis]
MFCDAVNYKTLKMSEVVKMKQGMSYSSKEKTIIMNVFKYFRLNYPDLCVTEVVRRTAKATGCSEKSIFQFRKEEASPRGFKEPSKTKTRKNININSRDIKYGEQIRQSIRNIIYDLKHQNIVPSLSTILRKVNADAQLPNFSLMTLRRLMFDMGFYYEKNGNRAVLTEKPLLKNETKSQSGCFSKSSNNNNNASVSDYKQEIANVPPFSVNSGFLDHQQNNCNLMTSLYMTPSTGFMVPPPPSTPAPHSMPMMLTHRRDLTPIVPHHNLVPPNSSENYTKQSVTSWGPPVMEQ